MKMSKNCAAQRQVTMSHFLSPFGDSNKGTTSDETAVEAAFESEKSDSTIFSPSEFLQGTRTED